MNAVAEPRSTRSLAQQIKAADAALLGPLKAIEEFGRAHRQWSRTAYEGRNRWPSEIGYMRSTEAGLPGLVSSIEWRLAHLPEQQALAAVAAPLAALTAAPANGNKNRLLLGLLIDAFPNARPLNPDGYFERLVFEVTDAGYSPSAVALAAKDLVRKCTFPPSIAETITACDAARDVLGGYQALISATNATREHLLHGLQQTRAAITAAGAGQQ